MTELEIIRRIEQKLGVKLERTSRISWNTQGFEMNSKYRITGLSLYNCEIATLDQIIVDLTGLGQLTLLYLYDNQISDISPLKKLPHLTQLEISRNHINDISPLKELRGLTTLHLSGNHISDISPLKELRQLTRLYLLVNKISNISSLKELRGLTELYLTNNQISDISPLKELRQLTQLDLSGNLIGDIGPLKELRRLTLLHLIVNKISDISPLKELRGLTELYLHNNQICDISLLKELRGLKTLHLSNNRITDISPLKVLLQLTRLLLNNNQISDISPLKELWQLTELGLRDNQISDISPLKSLNRLVLLDLSENQVERLPQWVVDLDMHIRYENSYLDNDLNLYNNPLKNPPVEIIEKGKEAIKRYFERIAVEGLDYIYEGKLILVGEGAAGKTSLRTRLMGNTEKLPKADTRTRGIEIKDWIFKNENGNEHTAHIWDFGGQDVYYPVHRFFLTENSVFVLLATTRQTHHNFDYWIPTIYQFGGSSPIILGQTCHEGNRAPWNDLGYYMGNTDFNIVRTSGRVYYELNLPNNNDGLEAIKDTIIGQLTGLPHYGKPVPKSWAAVREVIKQRATTDACISFETFRQLCRDANAVTFTEEVDIADCAGFLHRIGVVLWYADNEVLKDWVVLQPQWAMNAVYKIIDDDTVQRQNGTIRKADFARLWQEPCYLNQHTILKQMLAVFQIAFPKKHNRNEYIIPARLESIPTEAKWKEQQCLRLEYHYDFMPRGLVNQLSAELSSYIPADEEVWNNAVNFTLEGNTHGQVEEDTYFRKISIHAAGKDARALIVRIMEALKEITDGYRGVQPKISVPCTCRECAKSDKPTMFPYEQLLKKSEKNERATVTCNDSDEVLSVDTLLRNVGLKKTEEEKSENAGLKTIKLFLASSSELKMDRLDFEVFIGRENKRLIKEGIFLELNLWEDFIDAMSSTRLQNEYNRVVRDCDIFVSLFFTKVGMYTAEEFGQAFGQFQETGKPHIYTYFKNGSVNMQEIREADISSKFAFQQRLKDLGHFPTVYENRDSLLFQFRNQLDMLLPKL